MPTLTQISSRTLVKAFCFTALALLLNACSDPRPRDCQKLISKWSTVIHRMEKSGRFSAEFIKQHQIQREMVNLLAHLSDKKEAEKRNAECLKYATIIEPQVKLSKIIDSLSASHLEERFPPPLGVNIGAKRK